MLDPEFSILKDFPPVEYDQWKALAEESLQGAPFEKKLVTHSYEGLDIQPVYTAQDQLAGGDVSGFPGSAPFVRGTTAAGQVASGWDLRQEHATPEPKAANAALLEDLNGGVNSLQIVFDRAVRGGFDAADDRATDLVGQQGLMSYRLADLERALRDVQFSMISVGVEAGAAFLPIAAQLIALWRKQNLASKEIRGAFNADPLALLAREGHLPIPLESTLSQMANLAKWTAEHYPKVTAVSVDTSAYHHAGATAAQDLAFAMATAVQYLRTMTDAGLPIDTAARQILFRMSLGTHHFLSIAKLRAGRRLWSRVVDVCGGTPKSAAMHVHARTSERVLTRKDPYVNLLRNTVSIFAAGIGGAEVVTSLPFDFATGQSDSFSRRVARNTALILQEEAHLHRVIDPAGGSWFLEKLTGQIAEKAWEMFQEIERQGGIITALETGWAADQIGAAFAQRAKDIATRKAGITGVSEFPNIEEQRVLHPPPDRDALRQTASQQLAKAHVEIAELDEILATAPCVETIVQAVAAGATLGQLAAALGFHQETTEIVPLEMHRFAEPFEQLRDAGDSWQAQHGHRPRVFLANMGSIAHHTARATYSQGFFEAGGFEVITNSGFADAESAAKACADSGASIAVLCSSDKLYPEFVPAVTPKLKAAGVRTVVLAGRPGENEVIWREAGVDRFIYISCNVLATLKEMLAEEGVLTL